jgi:hypothetical protein
MAVDVRTGAVRALGLAGEAVVEGRAAETDTPQTLADSAVESMDVTVGATVAVAGESFRPMWTENRSVEDAGDGLAKVMVFLGLMAVVVWVPKNRRMRDQETWVHMCRRQTCLYPRYAFYPDV